MDVTEPAEICFRRMRIL